MLDNPEQGFTVWDDGHWQIVACNDEITALSDDTPIFSEPVFGQHDCAQVIEMFLRRFTDWSDEDIDEPNDEGERELELIEATEDFLQVILDEDGLDPEVIHDVLEHTLTFLAKAGYGVYRPMWLETPDGEKFWTDHPYDHLI